MRSMRTELLTLSTILLFIFSCENTSSSSSKDDEYTMTTKDSRSVSSSNIFDLEKLKNIVLDYDNSMLIIEGSSYREIEFKREFDDNCKSDVYQLYLKGTVARDSPYLEYHECVEGVKSISISASSEHFDSISTLLAQAMQNGSVEDYSEEYEDGSFDKEYSKDDLAIAFSSTLLSDNTLAYTFNLMNIP